MGRMSMHFANAFGGLEKYTDNLRSKLEETTASVKMEINIDKLPFDDNKKTEEYFSRLSLALSNPQGRLIVSLEDKQYFVAHGANEEFLEPNQELWYNRDSTSGYINTDDVFIAMLEKKLLDVLFNELDCSVADERNLFKSAIRGYYLTPKSNQFNLQDRINQMLEIKDNDEHRNQLISSLSEVCDETDKLYLGRYYDDFGHLFPDDYKVKVLANRWLDFSGVENNKHEEYASTYKELTGNNIDDLRNDKGRNRFEILSQDVTISYVDVASEIAKFYSDDYIKLFDNLPEAESKEYDNLLNIYSSVYPKFYNNNEHQTNEQTSQKLYSKYGMKIFQSSKFLNREKYKTDAMGRLYLSGKLNDKEQQILSNLISHGELEDLEPSFAAHNKTAYSFRTLPGAIDYAQTKDADITVERAIAKPLIFEGAEDKAKVLNSFILAGNNKKDYFESHPQIKEKFLSEIKPHLAIKNFVSYEFFRANDLIDFVQLYKDKLPATQLMKDIGEYVLKEGVDLNKEHSSLFKTYGIKSISPEKFLRYDKGRTLNVSKDFFETDLSCVDFNKIGNFAPNYHTSYRSKTTFLNEMCIYGHAKLAAIAINHGADVFVENEFALGAKTGLPFPGMFRRDAKDDYASASQFMETLALNLEENKGKVLNDIWTSLGKNLRAVPQVDAIIKKTNKIYTSRNFAQEREAVRIAEEQRQEEQRRIAEENAKRLEAELRLQEQKDRENNTETIKNKIQLEINNDLASFSNKDIALKIVDYLKENKEKLKIIPNNEEINTINEQLVSDRDVARRNRTEKNSNKIREMSEKISYLSYSRDHENEIMPAEKVVDLIEQHYAQDADAAPFIEGFKEGESAYIVNRQKEATRKIVLMKDFEKTALEYLEKEEAKGKEYSAMGKRIKEVVRTEIITKIHKDLGLVCGDKDLYKYGERFNNAVNKRDEERFENEKCAYQSYVINQQPSIEEDDDSGVPVKGSSKDEVKQAKKASQKQEAAEQPLDLSALMNKFSGKKGRK